MAVGDIYETRLEGTTAEATRWNLVVHYELTTEANANLFETSVGLAQAIWDNATGTGGVVENMNDVAEALTVRANRVHPSVGVPGTNTGPTVFGGVVGEAMPAQSAAVITKRTAEPGRSGRGRNYLPNLSEINQDAGVMTDSVAQDFLTGYETTYPLTLTDGESNEWELVVFSRTLADQAAPEVAFAVATTEIDRVIRRQGPRGDVPRRPTS